MKKWLVDFLRDEEGASGIEYALVASMVALAIVAFVDPVKAAVTGIFGQISAALVTP